jgi:hypothetical protein
MKFVDTIKTDITWLVVQGTDVELDKLIAWTEKHRTMYVIAGKRREHIVFDGPVTNPHNAQQILARIRAKSPGAVREQRFGFKAASDALRCKLSLA